MAFPSITAYTAGEKAKVKADLDELAAQIDATITHTRAVGGLETDEEKALTVFKAVITQRAAALGA